ncbi:MAG: hypothetical protein ACOYN0_07825 [Phycisphaerales bacterium]
MLAHSMKLIAAASLAACSSGALAGIRPVVAIPGVNDLEIADPRIGDVAEGYDDRTPGQRGVRTGDLASFSINVTTLDNNNYFANLGGDTAVVRGSTYRSVGAHRFGAGEVRAQWDEVVNSGRTYVSLSFRTSNAAPFVPGGASVNGSEVVGWNWRFGLTDPVDYQPNVVSVLLRSATAFYSANDGQSFFSAQTLGGLPADFMPGSDPGTPLVANGNGANYVLIRYEIDVTIPAPGALGLLAGTAVAMRRRRR